MLIKVFLEAFENLSDFFWFSKVTNGVIDGVVVFQPKHGTKLFLFELLYSTPYIVGQDEIEKYLLLSVKMFTNDYLGFCFCSFTPAICRCSLM